MQLHSNAGLNYAPGVCKFFYVFTLCEVVGFAHVDADEGHELELRETLTRRRRQGQQVPQIGDL